MAFFESQKPMKSHLEVQFASLKNRILSSPSNPACKHQEPTSSPSFIKGSLSKRVPKDGKMAKPTAKNVQKQSDPRNTSETLEKSIVLVSREINQKKTMLKALQVELVAYKKRTGALSNHLGPLKSYIENEVQKQKLVEKDSFEKERVELPKTKEELLLLKNEIFRLKILEKKLKASEFSHAERLKSTEELGRVQRLSVLQANQRTMKSLQQLYLNTAFKATSSLFEKIVMVRKSIFLFRLKKHLITLDVRAQNLGSLCLKHNLAKSQNTLFYFKTWVLATKTLKTRAKGVEEMSLAMLQRKIMNGYFRRWRSAFDIKNIKKLLKWQAGKLIAVIWQKRLRTCLGRPCLRTWSSRVHSSRKTSNFLRKSERTWRKFRERSCFRRLFSLHSSENRSKAIAFQSSSPVMKRNLIWAFGQMKRVWFKSKNLSLLLRTKAWIRWKGFHLARKNQKRARSCLELLKKKRHFVKKTQFFEVWRKKFLQKQLNESNRKRSGSSEKQKTGNEWLPSSQKAKEQLMHKMLEKIDEKRERTSKRNGLSKLIQFKKRRHLGEQTVSLLFETARSHCLKAAWAAIQIVSQIQSNKSLAEKIKVKEASNANLLLKVNTRNEHLLDTNKSIQITSLKRFSTVLSEALKRASAHGFHVLVDSHCKKKVLRMKGQSINQAKNALLLKRGMNIWIKRFSEKKTAASIHLFVGHVSRLEHSKKTQRAFYSWKSFAKNKKWTIQFLLNSKYANSTTRRKKFFYLNSWRWNLAGWKQTQAIIENQGYLALVQRAQAALANVAFQNEELSSLDAREMGSLQRLKQNLAVSKILKVMGKKKAVFRRILNESLKNGKIRRKIKFLVSKTLPSFASRLVFHALKDFAHEKAIKKMQTHEEEAKNFRRERKTEQHFHLELVRQQNSELKKQLHEDRIHLDRQRKMVKVLETKIKQEIVESLWPRRIKTKIFLEWKRQKTRGLGLLKKVTKVHTNQKKAWAFKMLLECFEIKRKRSRLRELVMKFEEQKRLLAMKSALHHFGLQGLESFKSLAYSQAQSHREYSLLKSREASLARKTLDKQVIQIFHKKAKAKFFHLFLSQLRFKRVSFKKVEGFEQKNSKERKFNAFCLLKTATTLEKRKKLKEKMVNGLCERHLLERTLKALSSKLDARRKLKRFWEMAARQTTGKKRRAVMKWLVQKEKAKATHDKMAKEGFFRVFIFMKGAFSDLKKKAFKKIKEDSGLKTLKDSQMNSAIFLIEGVVRRHLQENFLALRRQMNKNLEILEKLDQNEPYNAETNKAIMLRLRRNELEHFLGSKTEEVDLFHQKSRKRLLGVWLQVICRVKLKTKGQQALVKAFASMKDRLARKKRVKMLLRSCLSRTKMDPNAATSFAKWKKISVKAKRSFLSLPKDKCQLLLEKERRKTQILSEEARFLKRAQTDFTSVIARFQLLRSNLKRKTLSRVLKNSQRVSPRQALAQWFDNVVEMRQTLNDSMYSHAAGRIERIWEEIKEAERIVDSLQNENNKLREIGMNPVLMHQSIREAMGEKERLSLELIDQDSKKERLIREKENSLKNLEGLWKDAMELKELAKEFDERKENKELRNLEETLRIMSSIQS